MKTKVMILVSVFLSAFTIACSDDEKLIDENALPQSARDFINTHFAGESVTRAVKDTEGKTEYEVWLSNGFKLEFNQSGAWHEIDGYGVEIPSSIQAELPASIITFIEENHATQVITKLEIDRGNYEVYLIGGLEIVFSSTGEFIRYDD